MNIRIATPYSNLFDNETNKKAIIGLSDLIEIREANQNSNVTKSILWHCELSLVISWKQEQIDHLSSIVEGICKNCLQLEVASFHLPSCFQFNSTLEGAFIGQGLPMTEKEMLANALRNSKIIRHILNDAGFSGAKLLVENNNHLGTHAYDVVTEPRFINMLLNATEFNLLLDIAHAKISAYNTQQSEECYFESLPIDRVGQVHLSRHSVKNGLALDTHDALLDDDWIFFRNLRPRMPQLNYVTIEYYKDINTLIKLLKRLRIELKD